MEDVKDRAGSTRDNRRTAERGDPAPHRPPQARGAPSIGIFPTRDEIVRLVGAVLAEQTDEWAEGRRYLGLDVLARCRLRTVPNTKSEVDTEPLPALTT